MGKIRDVINKIINTNKLREYNSAPLVTTILLLIALMIYLLSKFN